MESRLVVVFSVFFTLGMCTADTIFEQTDTKWPTEDVYSGCGRTRKCFGVPDQCLVGKNCENLVVYEKVNADGRIPFELYGSAPNATFANNFWVGFGASSSGQMDFAAVVQCVHYSNGSNDVVGAFNGDSKYTTLTDYRVGIHKVRATFVDGFVRCAFDLDVERTVMGNTFNLENPYSLLLGSGWIEEKKTNQYDLQIHVKIPFISPKKVTFSCGLECQSDDVYFDCSSTRKCFGVPEDCVASKKCDQLVTYEKVDADGRIPFELYGKAPNSTYADNFWVGFGASSSGQMDFSSVVQCVHYSNGSNDVVGAYNGDSSYTTLEDHRVGIYNVRPAFVDGYVRCAFDLDVERTVMGNKFNLANPYSLLLGSGWINETGLNSYELMIHVEVPFISPDRVVFSCGNQCGFPPAANGTGRFGSPKGCEDNKSCRMLVTYGLSQTNTSRVAFTLRGTSESDSNSTTKGQFYVAVALAPETKMSYAYVMECVAWEDGGRTTRGVFASYNGKKHENSRIAADGLYLTQSSYVDGVLECDFESDLVHIVDDSLVDSDHNKTFDLSQPYHLLLAIGPLKSGNRISEHRHKDSSSTKVIVAQGGSAIPGSPNLMMKKAHAILMVIAWNFLAAIGIIMAKQTRDMWPETQLLGGKVWFQVHRTIMSLAATLSVIGIIIIFVDIGEWADIPHAYVGIVTFSLAVVQPCFALFRPHPGTPKRPYFNFFHHLIGYSTQILAAVALFLGIRLEALGVSSAAVYVVVACAGANLTIQLGLELYKFCQRKSRMYKSDSNEDLTPSEDDSTMTSFSSPATGTGLSPDDKVRQSLLTLDGVVIAGGTLAVIVLIAVA